MSIYLESYNRNWKIEFERLKAVLMAALEGSDIEIQHIGSTAVPGLLSKPILDIDIIVNDANSLERISESLILLGYIGKGEQGVPGRFAFRQRSESTPKVEDNSKWQQHHLYVCLEDSPSLKNHLMFRDILLKHPALVTEYAQLKERLAREPGMTREYYTVRKTEFITKILRSVGFDR